jgi:hypothetical protein
MGILKKYAYNFFLGLDQFLNAILLGDPDESVSGRTGRAYLSGKGKWWVPALRRHLNWVFKHFGDYPHCENSVEPEERPLEKEIWSWIK